MSIKRHHSDFHTEATFLGQFVTFLRGKPDFGQFLNQETCLFKSVVTVHQTVYGNPGMPQAASNNLATYHSEQEMPVSIVFLVLNKTKPK